MRVCVSDSVCLCARGSLWVFMSPPVSDSEIWDTRSVWQKLLEELPRLRHESLIMKPPDSWSKRRREGWKKGGHVSEGGIVGGGQRRSNETGNCQLCFNSDYVCILQQNKREWWRWRRRCVSEQTEKGEGRQLNSKPAHTVMWMRKGGIDESWSWWEMSVGMKEREMKAEIKVWLFWLFRAVCYYSGLF